MNAKEFVDWVLQDHEHLLDDFEESEHRPRTLRNAQRALNHIWLAANWPWKKGQADVVISDGLAGGFGNLPADFQAFGHEVRKLQVKNEQRFVHRRLRHELLALQVGRLTASHPDICAVTGQSSLGVQVLSAYPYVSAPVTLVAVYDRKQPELKDGVEPGVASGLEEIPEPYHWTAMYEWTLVFMMRDKGDIRAETSQKTAAKEALAQMITSEMPSRGIEQRMPVHGAISAMYGRR